MALFRAVRFSHQMRVRRMLLHHVARRSRAAAPPLPMHATLLDSSTPAEAAGGTANAASLDVPVVRKRRGRGGRSRRHKSAHLTADQVAEAMIADEEAQATGRGSVGLAELLADMGEDEMATTAAQNRAVRNVLRRRHRGAVVTSQGVTARKQLQQHSRRLTAFDGRPSPKNQPILTAAAGERMKRIRAEFVSPSHPYFVLTRAAESFAPEAVLPQPYYGINGRLPGSRHGGAQVASTAGSTQGSRKVASASTAAGTTSVAGVSGSTYDATGGPVAKAVQRAAARHAFFFAHLQKEGCEEAVSKTAYRLRHEWRRLTSRQKNTYVPETVRGNVLAAAHGEDLGDQVPHVAQAEDDCVVVPPTDGMRLHHIDAEAESLPHFYTVRPRSTVTRLVRTPFQLFADAHIDTARAEVESREAKANAKAAGQPKQHAAAAASVAEEGDEPRAVFTSHAITRAAVHTLAEAWTDLRPADKHAYANMAEGFTASSKRYFDAAFAQLRKIHRQNPGGAHDDVDDLPYDAADPLVPALLKRGRPMNESAGDAQAKAWVRLPVSPVVRRRQEARCGGAHAESV